MSPLFMHAKIHTKISFGQFHGPASSHEDCVNFVDSSKLIMDLSYELKKNHEFN